jgi:predicted Zn-dependent peptidase
MYALGCKFYATTDDKRSYITITGPEENFDAAVEIVEDLIQNPVADENAFIEMIADEEKSRSDNKLNNRVVASRLASYALYGAENPNTWLLNGAELKKLESRELVAAIQSLGSMPHSINYFGQRPMGGVKEVLSQKHRVEKTSTPPAPKEFPLRESPGKEVFMVHYDMVQANIFWLNKSAVYDPAQEPVISLYNQYFGGDMSSVVFQNIRESKALAYSTYAYYATPAWAGKSNYVKAFIGTQADKFQDAVAAMNELIKKLPADENVFALSKQSLLNRLETERISDEQLINYQYRMQDLGWNKDMNFTLYNSIPALTLKDIDRFHQQNIAAAKYTYAILCNEKSITADVLSKYGKLTRLSLEDVFGY